MRDNTREREMQHKILLRKSEGEGGVRLRERGNERRGQQETMRERLMQHKSLTKSEGERLGRRESLIMGPVALPIV